MNNVTTITQAEIVDENHYHVFTDKGIFLLNINNMYPFAGDGIPSFATVQQAVEYFNN